MTCGQPRRRQWRRQGCEWHHQTHQWGLAHPGGKSLMWCPRRTFQPCSWSPTHTSVGSLSHLMTICPPLHPLPHTSSPPPPVSPPLLLLRPPPHLPLHSLSPWERSHLWVPALRRLCPLPLLKRPKSIPVPRTPIKLSRSHPASC